MGRSWIVAVTTLLLSAACSSEPDVRLYASFSKPSINALYDWAHDGYPYCGGGYDECERITLDSGAARYEYDEEVNGIYTCYEATIERGEQVDDGDPTVFRWHSTETRPQCVWASYDDRDEDIVAELESANASAEIWERAVSYSEVMEDVGD